MKIGVKPSELDVSIEEEIATVDQGQLEQRRVRVEVRRGERERERKSEVSQVT